MWTWGPRSSGVAENDPYYSFVKSLVLAEVASGATTFPDSIVANPTPSRDTSGPTGSTAVAPPFGSGTALWGATPLAQHSLLVFPSNWIGTGFGTFHGTAFCIDAWVRPTSIATRAQCIGGDDFVSGSTSWNGYLIVGTSGSLLWTSRAGSISAAAGTIVQDVWQHVAVSGNGSGTMTMYVNGASVGSVATSSYTAQNSGNWLWGEENQSVGGFERNFIGHMKCMRITWGHRRYSGAFTPPSSIAAYAP